MGADFIGCFVPMTRSQEEAVEVLRSLPDESIIRAIEDTNLDWRWDDDEHFWTFSDDDETDPTLNRENMLKELEGYVQIAYDILRDRHRVASWFSHDDVRFIVTGGLSWGETPDFYDELNILYHLGVTYDPTMELTWVRRPVPTE